MFIYNYILINKHKQSNITNKNSENHRPLLRQALAPAVGPRHQRRLQRARLQRALGVAHALQQGEAQAVGPRELLVWTMD